MIVPKVDSLKYLGLCNSLFEEMKLRCGAEIAEEYDLWTKQIHVHGFQYRVCPLPVFGFYQDTSRSKLAIVLYERLTNTRGEGFADIGLVSPAPLAENYGLETLQHSALLYIALSVLPRVQGNFDIRADVYRSGSLLGGREFRDIVSFVEDSMFEKVAKHLPPEALTAFGERGRAT